MRDKVSTDGQEIYDRLVERGVRHPLVTWGWNERTQKEGYFYIEFNGNAEWLGGSKKEALEKIDMVFE